MSGIIHKRVTLDGSGNDVSADNGNALTAWGIISTIRVVPSGGTPDVTIRDTTEIFLNDVTVSTDTSYTPQKVVQDNAGTAQSVYTPYFAAGRITVDVSGGAASGYVDIYIKVAQ